MTLFSGMGEATGSCPTFVLKAKSRPKSWHMLGGTVATGLHGLASGMDQQASRLQGIFGLQKSMGIVIFAQLFFQVILPWVVRSESIITVGHVVQGKATQATWSKREGFLRAAGILRDGTSSW